MQLPIYDRHPRRALAVLNADYGVENVRGEHGIPEILGVALRAAEAFGFVGCLHALVRHEQCIVVGAIDVDGCQAQAYGAFIPCPAHVRATARPFCVCQSALSETDTCNLS
jgi:hypothetical protein